MEMTKKRIVALTLGLAALAAGALYFFLYQPLCEKNAAKGKECNQLESQAEQVRRNVSILAIRGRESHFVGTDEISSVIEELTQRGRARTVTFLSITPQPVEKTEPAFQVLPIEMEIESSYQALGEFLGDLDDLTKCLVTVRAFESVPLSKDSDKIRSKLTVNMHLRG